MIHVKIKDIDLKFETESSMFSPNSIDNGTLALLSVIDFLPSDKVLDLGCGYGAVGILAGKLIGEENDFTLILCNPPYHADFLFQRNLLKLVLRNWLWAESWLWLPKDLIGIKIS